MNTFPTTEDYWDNLDAAYGGNYVELNATEAANADLFALVDEKLGDEAANTMPALSQARLSTR